MGQTFYTICNNFVLALFLGIYAALYLMLLGLLHTFAQYPATALSQFLM